MPCLLAPLSFRRTLPVAALFLGLTTSAGAVFDAEWLGEFDQQQDADNPPVWSDSDNWVDDIIPDNDASNDGDDVLFSDAPESESILSRIDQDWGVRSLTIGEWGDEARNYLFDAPDDQDIVLTIGLGGITVDAGQPDAQTLFNLDLLLADNQQWTVDAGNDEGAGLFLFGPLDLDEHRLTIGHADAGGTAQFFGDIQGQGGITIDAGEDGEVLLAGENTFQSNLQLQSGRVLLASEDALGDTDAVEVIGDASIAGAMEDPFQLQQDIDLQGDLEFAGQIFVHGQTSLSGDHRTISVDEQSVVTFEEVIQIDGDHRLTFDTDPSGFIDVQSAIQADDQDAHGLHITGGGELRLAGDNTFQGDVTFEQGTLVLAHENALGNSQIITIPGLEEDNGVIPDVELEAQGLDAEIDQDITLQNTLTLVDGEAFTFQGDITATQTEDSLPGFLSENENTTRFTGGISIANPADELVFDGTGDFSIENIIDGDGGLRSQGQGNLILGENVVHTYTGDTHIEQGLFELRDNTIIQSSETFIHSDATLSLFQGTQIGADTTIHAGGTIRGQGQIDGELTFEAIEGQNLPVLAFRFGDPADPPVAIQVNTLTLDVTGTLDEAVVIDIEQTDPFFITGDDSFAVLEADAGEFNATADDFLIDFDDLFVSFTARVEDDALFIDAQRDDLEDSARGRDNRRIARAIDSGLDQTGIQELFALVTAVGDDTDLFNENLRQLSPEPYTATASLSTRASRTYTRTLSDYLQRQHTGRQYFRAMSNLGPLPSGPVMDSATIASRVGRPISENSDLNHTDQPWNVFATAFGIRDNRDTTSDRTGFRATTGGILTGFDYAIDEHISLGITAGYQYTDLDFRQNRGHGHTHQARFGPFATFYHDHFFATGSLTYAYHDNNVRRRANLNSGTESTTGNFSAHDLSLSAAVGTEFALPDDATFITPQASLHYMFYNQRGFTESGSDVIDLEVDSDTLNSLETGIAVALSQHWQVDRFIVVPEVSLGYSYEWLADDTDVTARFDAGGDSFTIRGPSVDRHSLHVGAGAQALLTRDLSTFLRYDARIQDDADTHALSAGFNFRF